MRNDFTSLSDPKWMNTDSVERYVACLISSNYPPMPTAIRLARAVQRAYEMGHHEGARVTRAIYMQRRRKR